MIRVEDNTINKNLITLESSSDTGDFDADLFSHNLDIWACQGVKRLSAGSIRLTVY